MKWKKTICAISVVSMLFSGTQAARASYGYISKDTTNVVTISNVGIKLVYENERADVVTVGQKIEQKVAIENTGKTAAYVRLQFQKYWTEPDTIDDEGNKMEGEQSADSKRNDVQNIFLDIKDDADWTDENWTYNRKDGCYYYKKLLPVGEKTEPLPYTYYVTDGVLEDVTDEAGNVIGRRYKREYENMQGNVKAYGEAVQEIAPQYVEQYIKFDSENHEKVIGWKNIEIDPQSIERTVDPLATEPPNETDVKFDEEADKFVTLQGDNLFLNMGNMLPGDTQTQKIDIYNSSNETVDIYLYAEPAENDYTDAEAREAMNKLLSQLRLQIGEYSAETGEKVPSEIFDNTLGKMSDEKGFENKILLGTFKKGDRVSLLASITLDPEWKIGNAETKIKWVFFCSKRNTNVNPPGGYEIVTDTPVTTPPVVTETPLPSKTPEVTETPVVTKSPSPKPAATPAEPEKTMPPSPEPTKPVTPAMTPSPEPEKTPEPTPIYTEVIITPLVPKPSKGPIGEADLGDATAKPVDKLPTKNPIEKEDDIIDPYGDVKHEKKSPAPEATKHSNQKNPDKPYTNPKTGDRNRMIFWIIMFVLSCTVFFATAKDSGKKYRR